MKSYLAPLNNERAFKTFFEDEGNHPLLVALLNDFLSLPDKAKITQVFAFDSDDKHEMLDLGAKRIQLLPSGKWRTEIISVKMQMMSRPYPTARLVFDACKLYSERLKNVYSLVFTTFNMPEFADLPDYYHYCNMGNGQVPYVCLTSALNFIVVELSKFARPLGQLLDSQEEWCYLLKQSGQMNRRECEALALRGKIMSKAISALRV